MADSVAIPTAKASGTDEVSRRVTGGSVVKDAEDLAMEVVRHSSTFKPQSLGSAFRPEDVPALDVPVAAKEVTGWSVCSLHEDLPQLTVKAIIVGCLVGVLCSFLSLYYGLRTGVIPSFNILSGLGGFVLLRALIKVRLLKGIFTPQENAVIQTTAVAAYSVSCPSFGFSSGFLAMGYNSYAEVGAGMDGNSLSDTIDLNWWRSLVWCFSLAFFGFFIAFPIRDYTILKQRLAFPSGTATSYIIKSMHKSAESSAAAFGYLAKFFSISFVTSMVLLLFDGAAEMPIFGMNAAKYGWSLDFDIGSIGIGMLLTPQVNISMLLGGIVAQGVLVPLLKTYRDGPGGWIDEEGVNPDGSPLHPSFLGTKCYTVFAGLGIMMVQGVFSILVLGWTLFKQQRDKRRNLRATESSQEEGLEVELQSDLDRIFTRNRYPTWMPPLGYAISGAACVICLHFIFKVKWYQTLVALLIIPILSFANIQGVGRTDWDLAASYGKLMMFPFGAWNMNKSIIPSLALCVVTISGCSNSAVLLQDFKTGYLLGADPNSMFLAQVYGTVWGCLVTPTLFALLTSAFKIPDANGYITGLYGPIYRTLAVVATGSGFGSLPTGCVAITLGFMAFAIVLNIMELVVPPRIMKYMPEPAAFSTGILVGAAVPMDFFLGGAIAAYWQWWDPVEARDKRNYIASGCVAGTGIAVACRCLMSILGYDPPMIMSFSSSPDFVLNTQTIVVGVVFLIFSIAVAACGLWHWFPHSTVTPCQRRRMQALEEFERLNVDRSEGDLSPTADAEADSATDDTPPLKSK